MDTWLQEYDELVQDILDSSYQTFSLNVQRWIDFLDSNDLIASNLHLWERVSDFNSFWAAAQQTRRGTVGSGQLNWPREAKERLGLQLQLFRKFGSGEIQVPPFALEFMYVNDGDFNVQTDNIGRRLFHPFAKELKRTIQKLDVSEPSSSVPASDRIVRLDHNSNAYAEAINSLNKLRDAVASSNEYPDQEDRAQRVAELDASVILLKSPQVRIGAVQTLTIRCLKYLGDKFVDGLVAVAVTAAIAGLVALFGLHSL